MNNQNYRLDYPLFEISHEITKNLKLETTEETWYVTTFRENSDKILEKRFFYNRHKAREFMIEKLKGRLL